MKKTFLTNMLPMIAAAVLAARTAATTLLQHPTTLFLFRNKLPKTTKPRQSRSQSLSAGMPRSPRRRLMKVLSLRNLRLATGS